MADTNRKLYFGFNQPFFGGPQGVVSPQYDDELIKNDMLQLLLTVPGERRYRPSFGTPIRTIVFNTLNEADLEQLRSDIVTAITENDERVNIINLVLEMNDNTKKLDIKLVFSVNGQPAKNYFVGLGLDDSSIVAINNEVII